MGFYKGSGLPPATEYSSGDEYLDLTTGKTYLNEGGSWKLISSKSSGVAFASLDSNGQVIERLSYEGAAGGVATLDTNGQVVEPPSGASITSLPQTSLAAGDIIPVVQGGVSKKAPAGQAGGLATLDASGKLAQPRRVLGVHTPPSWTNVDTTADFSTAPVVGIIDIPAASYARYVILLANIGLQSVDTDQIYLRGVFVYSTDGGTTWTQIDHNPAVSKVGLGQYANYQLSPRVLSLTPGTAYKLGIRAGNGVSGGPTVRVYGAPYSSFLALEVDY